MRASFASKSLYEIIITYVRAKINRSSAKIQTRGYVIFPNRLLKIKDGAAYSLQPRLIASIYVILNLFLNYLIMC